MTRARVLGVLAASVIASSCIDNGRGYVSVGFTEGAKGEIVDSEDGLRVRIELPSYIDSDGDVLLDSALVVINHDGQATSEADPDIEAAGFPLHNYGERTIVLEMPSPIEDVTSFDAFCETNGRSADVTLRFFTTTVDPDPSEAPPVTEFVTSLPLTIDGAPEPPNVIAGTPTELVPLGITSVDSVVMGPAGSILFVTTEGFEETYEAFRVDAFTQPQRSGLSGFRSPPRLASDDATVLYFAGPDDLDSLRFMRSSNGNGAEFSIERGVATPKYETFNVVALQPIANGLRAAVISAYPLAHPLLDPADGVPPDGKLYGSFIVEAAYLDGLLQPTSLLPIDREIVAWAPLAAGMVQISNELPPRSVDAVLRVERLDDAGIVVWSHDAPASAVDVDVDTQPDGSVLVAYGLPTGFIELVRLAADDGSELSRATFSGAHPTVGAYGTEGAMLSFSGRANQAGIAAPARSVPLLLELDGNLVAVRGAQIACSGRADLQRASDGALLIVGTFGERFTIGDEVLEAAGGSLILTNIPQPL